MPPTKAELVGHISGAELSVKEEEEVELKCVIHNARPRPDIIWYLGDREFVSGMSAIWLSIGSKAGGESLIHYLLTDRLSLESSS